jgi:hypothetical protein
MEKNVMQQRKNSALDLVQMQQAIGMRNLVRFGIVMGIALAGQILVTISLGTFAWMQQHVIFLVAIELVWWPPFFCMLYFSFIGVVKLVRMSPSSHKLIQKQFMDMAEEYQKRAIVYEMRLEEKDRYVHRLQAATRERIRVTRLEPMHSPQERSA